MKHGRRLLSRPGRAMGFFKDLMAFRRDDHSGQLSLKWRDLYPCLDDAVNKQTFDRHYLFHTAWAARILASTTPDLHCDFGSDLRFVSMVSAFLPIRYFDYRSTLLGLSGLTEASCDLTALPFADGALHSVSCMHVVEHVGLGRYGDPLRPDGDLQAMAELGRVVVPGGDLLFVVPIGHPRIEFNAHRVYAVEMIIDQFPQFDLKQFALIPDAPVDGGLVIDPSAQLLARQVYGCGCFWLQKKT